MKRILIVDDNEGIRCALRKALRKYDNNYVDSSDSVSDAAKKFEKNRYDVLITDINMPETSGIVLIRHIKDSFPDCKIIAISAEGGQLDAAKKSGASFCLLKPFSISEVLEKIAV